MKCCTLVLAALMLVACRPPAPGSATAEEARPSQSSASVKPHRKPDVIFVPTRRITVEAMLKLADVRPGDVLYDLGSGDGRIPIAAAKQFGIRAVGIEIDPARISEAKANARVAGVEHLVSFRNEDLFQADFSEATVVTLYLLPSLNEKLRPKLLRDLKPGARIVSHDFLMGDWPPEERVQVGPDMIFLWTVPERTAR
jgi:predicted O-methyltransferase YrrM